MQDTQQSWALSRLGPPLGVALAAGLACGAVWLGDPTTPGGPFPLCPTKALLGIDCPGCGALRMMYALLHGDVAVAVQYNALGVVAVALLLWAFGAWTYGRIVGRRITSWQHYRWSAAIVLALVAVWAVIRNIPYPPFTALRV